MEHDLSDEERKRVLIQVDYFIHILSDRYGIKPQEVVDTVKWVKTRQEAGTKLTMYAALSVLGLSIAGVGSAVWTGILHLLGKHP